MIRSLKSYKIIQGVRGQEPVNKCKFAEAVARVSVLVKIAPEISEMDLNPLFRQPGRSGCCRCKNKN